MASDSESDVESVELECSFTSIISVESNTGLVEEIDRLGVAPYRFEPYESGDDTEDTSENGDSDDEPPAPDVNTRRENTDWCNCNNCVVMDSTKECRCCQEVGEVIALIDCLETDDPPQCICDHPGFATVCLDQYVLDTAYLQYQQRYRDQDLERQIANERYRYTAYRQLARWSWGFLGRHVRVVLPS